MPPARRPGRCGKGHVTRRLAAPLRDCTDERFVEAVERGRRTSLEETVALVLELDQTEP